MPRDLFAAYRQSKPCSPAASMSCWSMMMRSVAICPAPRGWSQVEPVSDVCSRQGRRTRDRERPPPARDMSGAANSAMCSDVSLAQIAEQLSLGVDRVMTEGFALRSRAGGARHQAGARRHDRGDLPCSCLSAPRLPRFGVAPPSRSTPSEMAGADGGSPRPSRIFRAAGARRDVRLHPSPARSAVSPHRVLFPKQPATAEALAGRDRRAACDRSSSVDDGLIEASPQAEARRAPVGDLTREAAEFPGRS